MNYEPITGEPVGEDGMRYQEALAYRVVQVNGATAGNEIELPVTQPGNNTVQVLTSPLNGQFYVIGNANDVFTTAQTSRSLVPRTTTLQIETPRNCTTVLKKVYFFLHSLKLFEFCFICNIYFREMTEEEQLIMKSNVDEETK